MNTFTKGLIAILLLLFTVSAATANLTPFPVYGKVTSSGAPVVNAEVTVKNANNGIEATVLTDENGDYLVDWSNFDEFFRGGDTLVASLRFCSSESVCFKTAKIGGDGSLDLSFDIATVSTPVPSTVTVKSYVCSNGQVVSDSKQCPIEVVVTPPPVVKTQFQCADGTIEEDVSNCPEEPAGYALIVAGITVIILGLGALYGFYKNTELRGKYRWIPGFKGILDKTLKEYQAAVKAGDKAKADKLGKTLIKYSKTLGEKYLK